MKHSIFSSEGYSLRFNSKEELEEYQKAKHNLYMKFYDKEVKKYGYWRSNKCVYTNDPNDITKFDGRFMYNQYKKWPEKNKI